MVIMEVEPLTGCFDLPLELLKEPLIQAGGGHTKDDGEFEDGFEAGAVQAALVVGHVGGGAMTEQGSHLLLGEAQALSVEPEEVGRARSFGGTSGG